MVLFLHYFSVFSTLQKTMEAENSIDDRMRLLIAATIPGRMRYVELEAATEISADTWKNFWFKRRKADALMVERLGRARPEYAFWLATGGTDSLDGHRSPASAGCLELQAESLQTAESVLHKSVSATKAVEALYASAPEHAEEISQVLSGFLKGGLVHVIPKHLNHGLIDAAFKAIKDFNRAIKLREEERKLNA